MPTSFLTAEHEALREAAAALVAVRLVPDVGRWEDAGGPPPELLADLATAGLLAAHLPEAVGGGGGDLLDALVVAEELGRCGSRSLATALLSTVHGPASALAAVDDGAAREVAGAVAAGRGHVVEVRGAAAAADGAHGVDAPAQPVWLGEAATHALAVIEGAGGPVLVPAEADGWSLQDDAGAIGGRTGGRRLLALASAAGRRLRLDPAELDRHRAELTLLRAAAAVAAGQRTWDEARAYGLERTAFGRPVGRFQVNRHALARAATALTAARELVRSACWAAVTGAPPPLPAAGLAAHVDRVCAEVSEVALQLHGGYGYSMEFAVQRAWRDDVDAALATSAPGGRTQQ